MVWLISSPQSWLRSSCILGTTGPLTPPWASCCPRSCLDLQPNKCWAPSSRAQLAWFLFSCVLPSSPSPDLVAMTQLLLLIVALLVLGHVPPGRSEFKRCWKGQGACRPYCTRHEAYMQLCPDASLCCLAYGLKMAKTENV
uniref:Beta-defensin n=2 Tax=Suidae TaxID=9821 RepID=A0A8D1N894_PIG